MSPLRSLLVLPVLAVVTPTIASAQQQTVRPWDVRVSLGLGPHLAGDLQDTGVGPALGASLAFDWHFVTPVALELQLAGTMFPVSLPPDANLPGYLTDVSASVGIAVYPWGGLHFAVRGGAHDYLQQWTGGLEGEAAWDLYATPGFSLGPYVRGVYLFGAPGEQSAAYMLFGVTMAIGPASTLAPREVEAPPPPPPSRRTALPPSDLDGDGVPDDRDNCSGTPSGVHVDINGCPWAQQDAPPASPARPDRRRRRHP